MYLSSEDNTRANDATSSHLEIPVENSRLVNHPQSPQELEHKTPNLRLGELLAVIVNNLAQIRRHAFEDLDKGEGKSMYRPQRERNYPYRSKTKRLEVRAGKYTDGTSRK